MAMGKELFLKFWEKEAETTRKVLSRIPEGSDYRPDPKSRTAREIAWLVVRESIVLTHTCAWLAVCKARVDS
jgi:hypothetical protein